MSDPKRMVDWKKVNTAMFGGIYLGTILAGICLIVGVSPVLPIFLLLIFESILLVGMNMLKEWREVE